MYFGKFLLCFLLGVSLYHSQQIPKKHYPDYKQLFAQAEKLSNSAKPTDQTDALALKTYLEVIDILKDIKTDDPFLLKTYVSTGAFLQVLNRQKEAVFYYKKAISLKSAIPGMQDSVLFKPLVYCGNGYYQLDKPDTANIFYKQAEAIAEKYPDVSELERLYNTLGVISYSVGNYSKSITYYEKAISTLTGHSSFDNTFLVFYKNNLALALKKLKQYDRALSIYKELLKYHIETDKLLHNIGSVYLAMGDSRQALAYLKQVKYEDQKKFNDLGRAYFEEKDYSNAIVYLQKAVDFNAKANQGHKNSDYGITLKYMGDAWLAQGQPARALPYYQQSIGNLLLDFRSKDIYVNPANFNSVFNGIELMETLLAKSMAFKALYAKSGQLKDLQASLQTYLAFYKLANYIQVTYETDESRSLITDRKYASHQQPIDICQQLFKLTSDKKYIEQAFLLDEENKANTLSLYMEESKLKSGSGIPPALLKQEAGLKENITRISLKASGETD
ncbi:MAG: tetratricopeptide repeat protein, partial [Mucilaginibacter sp.]